ncbi:hypothetical protein HMPREF0509_01709 [Lactobacillus crispatus SJ-3C-US]|nr:hypothetical protein HMPREF5045_00725 [Lactobacillus crispatus 125-2-CHN]EEX29558.1 hypothetical protein HMPREF0508_00855 [Lactobacillus crispatus MV-3A-US]KFL92898.1 hypothetical protein HMPREF0509_01709 [Lactobacillus crispatus SJ-3C-US]KXI10467.1 hypothetical protein HMPREF3209_02524 [Lactobacillus crispatus]
MNMEGTIMNTISKHKANKFDKSFVGWMLVTQVVVIAVSAYLVSTGFFAALPV